MIKTIYCTDDGREFESKREAELYEAEGVFESERRKCFGNDPEAIHLYFNKMVKEDKEFWLALNRFVGAAEFKHADKRDFRGIPGIITAKEMASVNPDPLSQPEGDYDVNSTNDSGGD